MSKKQALAPGDEWTAGFICAIAAIVKINGGDTNVHEVFCCIGKKIKNETVDEGDFDALVEAGYIDKEGFTLRHGRRIHS
jgi:hypothetical protein